MFENNAASINREILNFLISYNQMLTILKAFQTRNKFLPPDELL